VRAPAGPWTSQASLLPWGFAANGLSALGGIAWNGGDMALPNLSGATLGRYHVEELLGEGEVGVVYRATQQPSDQQVALKVIDPGLASRPGFMRRFVSQTATISKLGHPGIVPVYEIGTRAHLTYLSMRLVQGGTLKDLLARGTLEAGTVWRILRAVADALHSAHEVGVVHQDLKPSNVLIGSDGAIMVTDFGVARINYGYAVGTPGYMSPEQAKGLEIDRRADVHALGLLAFEMLTGTRPYGAGSPIDRILSAVNDPVPSARAINPELPPELDVALFRALSKDPAQRPQTVVALLGELSQVPLSRVAAPGAAQQAWGDDYQLVTLFEASLDPVLAIDEAGLVTHWNRQAETMFGWTQQQIVGMPVLTSLIAPRYREMLERVFATFLAAPGQHETQAVEVVGVHRDGRQIPLELSLSLVQLSATRGRLVAFCRDISERKEAERLRSLQDAVADAFVETSTRGELPARVLELVCTHLDWAVGVYWRADADGEELSCSDYWQAASLEGPELESMTRRATYGRGAGVLGRVWATREAEWHPQLVRVAESARELAALRAGLQAVGAFPVQNGGEVLGVLEFFAAAGGAVGAARMIRVEAIGRRTARVLERMTDPEPAAPPPPAPGSESPARARRGERRPAAEPPGSLRFKIDARHSRLGFSCAFMKFLTVHGHFNDFSGWVEVDVGDPASSRAECVVKTASVDTDSLDRDYHLCSEDFFAVDSYPDMVFRSTSVQPRGEDRFRLRGDLTIRSVTKPITLEVRLEEREQEPSGAERATLTATTIIDRTDWFLDWEEALEAGRWIVGEQIKLDLEVTLVHRPGSLVGRD
jgi:PAS domain S-box-containing protein